MSENENGCAECDALRRREGKTQLVGKPCDICNGRGYDFLGHICRHCGERSGIAELARELR